MIFKNVDLNVDLNGQMLTLSPSFWDWKNLCFLYVPSISTAKNRSLGAESQKRKWAGTVVAVPKWRVDLRWSILMGVFHDSDCMVNVFFAVSFFLKKPGKQRT